MSIKVPEPTNPVPAKMREYMDKLLAKTDSEDIKKLFNNTFVNTWTTTIQISEDDAFVITGDIPAMWLRDSAAQVKNYLPIMLECDEIKSVISKVIARQMHSILMDPYANAFNFEGNGHGHTDDITDMSPWVWERKYEIDSLENGGIYGNFVESSMNFIGFRSVFSGFQCPIVPILRRHTCSKQNNAQHYQKSSSNQPDFCFLIHTVPPFLQSGF